ncbi:hypothetical protein ABLA30_08150 [Xenorhabdus nematophila]|uniref:hypothetical protein n=1 Tax=Xenorhabdus nematophila TaxID=628 RepID=UPI0032B7C3D4
MKLRLIIILISTLILPFLSLHAETSRNINKYKIIDCNNLNRKSGENGEDGIPNSDCKNGGKGGSNGGHDGKDGHNGN